MNPLLYDAALKIHPVFITPELAALCLLSDPRNQQIMPADVKNRKIDQQRVALYAADMTAGKWAATGQGIILSPEGMVLNGNHTLHACVKARTGFWSSVTTGVDKAASDSMDIGKVRTVGNILDTHHEINTCRLAAVLTLLCRYESGQLEGNRKVAPSLIQDALARHPLTRESVVVMGKLPKGLRNAESSAMYYLGSLINKSRTLAYFDKLTTGENLTAGDPALTLRTLLMGRGDKKTSKQFKGAVSIKALNHALNGTQCRRLSWSLGEDAYPSVLGIPYGQAIIVPALKEARIPIGGYIT